MRRLIPDVAETTIAEQVAELRPWEQAPEDRPYLITNFVITLDGEATIRGRSGPIGSEADTQMLVGLRSRVDALMIGAGTMRAERYGQVAGDAEKQGKREREGLRPERLMVLVSGRLDLPWDAPLFTEGAGQVVIYTYSDVEPPETETPVEVVRHEDRVDLAAAVRHLRAEHGVRALLSEGGPRLHAQLIDAGLVDELFVTHAPKVAGGPGPGLVVDLPERERPVELAWLLHEPATGELFARYYLRE